MIDRDDAEDWLNDCMDIWHHPYISDRNNQNFYELADLLAEFANYIVKLKTKDNDTRISDQMG